MDAAAWDARYAASESVWSLSPNQWVEDIVAGMATGAALDVAAGEGRNALWLAERGWRVLATDFSPVAIERLRERADRLPPQVRALVRAEVADATARPTQSQRGSCDLVLLSYLHLPPTQMAQALRAATQCLKVGGNLLVIGHAGINIERGVGGPQDRALLYDPSEVSAMVSGLPLSTQSCEIREREVTAQDRLALDTVALMRREPQP
ncbi:MAG: class I SAM-dependent methyltransferase [Ornithinimicrobium sp.]